MSRKALVDALLAFLRNSYYIFIFLIFYGPTSGGLVALKTGRREMPGSNPDRACRPSCSEFSVVFSETRINAG